MSLMMFIKNNVIFIIQLDGCLAGARSETEWQSLEPFRAAPSTLVASEYHLLVVSYYQNLLLEELTFGKLPSSLAP